eukprot:Sro707_g190560.2  (205) ;mRNA; f:15126-15740
MESDEQNIRLWVGDKADEINAALRKGFVRPALKAAVLACNVVMLREIFESQIIPNEALVRIVGELDLLTTLLSSSFVKKEECTPQRDQEVAECIRCLLSNGCDPNYPYMGLESMVHPLGVALVTKMHESARVLLEFGADPKKLGIVDLLSVSYKDCPDDILDTLREHGVVMKGRCMRACYPCCVCVWFCSYLCELKGALFSQSS